MKRVAIVGNHFAASVRPMATPRQHDLGRARLAARRQRRRYALVAQADDERRPPRATRCTSCSTTYAPAVILIDEWVAYARQLVRTRRPGRRHVRDPVHLRPGAHRGGQGRRRACCWRSRSRASDTSGDDARPRPVTPRRSAARTGCEALERLQNVVRRVADQWRPASADEAYHIVRQRLFVDADAEALASIGATARAFVELYRKHTDDFPREARDAAYEDRIKRTYPIHPELFDRLYEDWSTLERFQRTRGVLRLMNTVIHALWVGEDQSPLIMPGSIPLAPRQVNSELTQYLQDSWKAIIDADVDGPNSEPARSTTSKPLFGQRSLTKRLARTVFFGAAPTIGSRAQGLETQRVFLGTAIPGDVPGNFHSALTALADRDVLLLRRGRVLVRPAGQHHRAAPRTRPSDSTTRTCGPRSCAV